MERETEKERERERKREKEREREREDELKFFTLDYQIFNGYQFQSNLEFNQNFTHDEHLSVLLD